MAKVVSSFFLAALLFPLLFLVVAFHVDPLNLFGENRDIYLNLRGDDRVRAAQIIRSGSYNSVILGSSMLKRMNENTVSGSGIKYVNISTSGSPIYERTEYLKNLLANRNLRAVIFSLDHGLSLHKRRYPINTDPNTWMYLFDDFVFNDIRIYLEKDYAKCILKRLVKQCDLKKISARHSNKYYSNRLIRDEKISGLDGWIGPGGRWPVIRKRVKRIITGGVFVKSALTDYNDDLAELLSLAEKYKQTQFIFVIPPYSMGYLKLMHQFNEPLYNEYEAFLLSVYKTFKGVKNATVILLDGDPLTEDYNNYVDERHYIGPVMDALVNDIKNKKNFLQEHYDARIAYINQRVSNFNLIELLALYERR